MQNQFQFQIGGKLLTDILGGGLYSKVESVFAEYIANALDAQAKEIYIEYPDGDFQDDPDAKVVFHDNGNGFVWSNLFCVADSDKFQEFKEANTPVMGAKRIGRFSGFKIAHDIKFEEVKNYQSSSISFNQEDIDGGTLSQRTFELEEQSVSEEQAKKVTLYNLREKIIFPYKESLIAFLIEEFGYNPNIKIFINGEQIGEDDLAKNADKYPLSHNSEHFGKVSGCIYATRKTRGNKKREPGVIVRVNNRRVAGPTFFRSNKKFKDSTKNRIFGEVHADGLEKFIHTGRELLNSAGEEYNHFQNWIEGELDRIVGKIEEIPENGVYEKMIALPKVQKRFETMRSYEQAEATKILKALAPKLGRVKNENSLLNTIGLLVLRAIQDNDFAYILERIEQIDSEDVVGLSQLLEHWGFKEIIRVSKEVQERLRMIQKFEDMIRDKKTLELSGIHKVLEQNSWIFEERFGVFTSNRQLRTIAKLLGDKYDKKNGAKRPDIILKSLLDTEFLIVELKKPGLPIGLPETQQVLQYKTDLKNHFPEKQNVNCFLIGSKFDDYALEQFPKGNTQKLRLITLDQLILEAKTRLEWISKNIKEEYEDLSLEMESPFAEMEAKRIAEDLSIAMDE